MKIIQLKAENVKRVKAIQINPQGNLVVVGGNNAEGKTSTLDAIWMAIGGKRAIPADPVRKGSKYAEIEMITDGDLIIYRKIFPDRTSELEVTNKSGEILKSPQKILDSLVAKFSFDPLAFASYEPKKQMEILRELAGVDTSEIDARVEELDSERKTLGIEIASISGQIESKYKLLPETPMPKIDTADLENQLQSIMDKARIKNASTNAVKLKQWEVERTEKELVELRNQYTKLIEEHKVLTAELQQVIAADSQIPNPPESTSLRSQIAEAAQANVMAEQQIQRDGDLAFLNEKRKQQGALELDISNLKNERKKLISEAKLPVVGLELGDEGLLFNGIPFEQCSSAEQLRVSTAMGIALNPTLKVLLIRDGSLLDQNSLAMVAQMATAYDAQVWIERVGHGEECSVIIENGEIKQ